MVVMLLLFCISPFLKIRERNARCYTTWHGHTVKYVKNKPRPRNGIIIIKKENI